MSNSAMSQTHDGATGQPLAGGLYMALAMMAFIANDTIIKFLGSTMPLGQMLSVRGVMAVAIIGLVIWLGGGASELGRIVSRPVLLRASADLITTFLFLTALLNMPLANATAILQASPFAVIVLAAVFLGERVGWRRLSAVAIGFVGVLIIVRPSGDAFNIYSLVAVAAMFFVALRDILTRRISRNVPSGVIALANAVAVLIGGVVYGLWEGFEPMSQRDLALLALAACLLAAAYYLMVLTIRAADVATTAPFRYTIIIWSLVAGYLVFGTVPDAVAFIGIALIAGSGIYAVWRDARLRRRQRDH